MQPCAMCSTSTWAVHSINYREIIAPLTPDYQAAATERKPSQNWSVFLHNHAHQVWASDFLPVYDLFFRPLFIFFIIELGKRRVVHFGVTRSPTDEWTAQQLRQATPFGQTPRFLIRDNDSKYGASFTRVAEVSGIEVLRTPYRAPRANAFCERLLGSVRRECFESRADPWGEASAPSDQGIRRVLQFSSPTSRDRPNYPWGSGGPSSAESSNLCRWKCDPPPCVGRPTPRLPKGCMSADRASSRDRSGFWHFRKSFIGIVARYKLGV